MEFGWKGGKAAGHEARQRGVGDNPEDCPVCLTTYDDTVQRPRTLPCGHTYCTLCINGLTEQKQVICPTCRVRHTVPEAGHFPISYTLEAVIKRLKYTVVTSTSPPHCDGKGAGEAETPGQKGAAGLSRSMHSLLQEQEAKVLAAITACQEVQSQLDQYQTTLMGWHDQQQQLEDKLQAVINDSRSSRVLVQQEESKVTAKKKQVQQGEQQLHVVLETLRKVNTEQEAGAAVVDIVSCTDDAEQRLEECKEMFPDVHTVTNARKIIEASSASLQAFKSVLAALEAARAPAGAEGSERNLQAAPSSTIKDRLQALQTQTLKAEDLHSLKQPARNLLEAGRVFAVHRVEGQDRHAKITLDDEQLYLHFLQDQPLLLGVRTLQVDEVVPAAPPCLVFLDLAWLGNAPQRILIRLKLDTPLGRQFIMLCTGQRGPCYANTKLFRVTGKGKPGECVCGGDYRKNDGTGGAGLLPDLHKGEYWSSSRAGAVWGWTHRGPSHGALFGIVTRDRQDGLLLGGVFGEVVRGVDAVAAAAQLEDITNVTVVDCGVVVKE